MRGLILNNYYSIQKSMHTSTLLALAAVILLILTKEPIALRAALFLPFLLIPVQAFEVLKTDALSGWNRFEITLPVTRQQIVGSKYAIFILFVLVSIGIIGIVFFLTHVFYYPVFDTLFMNYSARGLGIVFCLAAITYPLTFKWGTEKSDTITMISFGITFATFFGLSFVLELFLGAPQHIDEIFSCLFLMIATLFLSCSYIVSVYIYSKKEF